MSFICALVLRYSNAAVTSRLLPGNCLDWTGYRVTVLLQLLPQHWKTSARALAA